MERTGADRAGATGGRGCGSGGAAGRSPETGSNFGFSDPREPASDRFSGAGLGADAGRVKAGSSPGLLGAGSDLAIGSAPLA